MKITKGKKQDEKEKKGKLPEPPIPVRIQVEPRKAGTVFLEVNAPPKKAGSKVQVEVKQAKSQPSKLPVSKPDSTVKVEVKPKKEGRRPETPSVKITKPAKSVEISTSGEKKPAPSVTVSIFNQAPAEKKPKKEMPSAKKAKLKAPARKLKPKPAKEKPKEILGSTLTRPEMYRKASSVTLSSSRGAVTEDDMKIIRDFMSRTGYLDNRIAEVNIRLSKIARVADIFTDKVNSTQKEVGDLKMKVASLKEERLDKDVSELRERADEMESIVEKISDKLRESKEESEKTISSETKKVKSIREDISILQSGVKELRGTLASLNTELTKLGDFKAFVQDRAKETDKEAAPDAIKNVTDRFDSLDSRMANMADKLMKVGRDMEKLTDYFMDGIKHMESRIMTMENEKSAESRFSVQAAETQVFAPTTYRSHLKHPELKATQTAQPMQRSETYELPEDEDMDIDDDYDIPRRPFYLSGPGVAMPQPPPTPPAGIPAAVAVKPSGYGQKVSSDTFQEKIPSAPAPDRGNMFTRLRESTVVRRPIEQIDPDMDVIMEHIRESIQLHQSREKITRDLMNAGFDQSLINQAFMRYRVG